MEDDYFLCIIEEMDHFGFDKSFFSRNPQLQLPSNLAKQLYHCQNLSHAQHQSLPLLPDEVASSSSSTDESHSLEMQASSESISVSLQNDSNNEEEKKERPTKINLGSRIRSHSTSLSAENRPRKSRKASRRLQKSMSCRTMEEVEIEEVKGFMDLGFIFKQESTSSQLMSLVPGLQRLGMTITQTEVTEQNPQLVMDKQVEQEEQSDNIRPYLSEAWLIERPDSPLLKLDSQVVFFCSHEETSPFLG